MKHLTSLMDNVIASRLGDIAINAGARRLDVGDSIDRGLILLRLLNEDGFDVVIRDKPKARKNADPEFLPGHGGSWSPLKGE